MVAPPNVEQLAANAIEILRTLVGFDTTSRGSNLALIEWVEAYLAGHGVASRRVPNADGSKANLLASIGPDIAGGVVLSGHTDVVPVDGQAWSSDPWSLTERDGRLYGRGTCDMKGFLALSLATVPALTQARLQKPVHLAFSYDEEVGCLGAPDLIAVIVAQVPPPAVVIVGDVNVARVRQWAEEIYGVIPKGQVPSRKPRSEPAQAGTRRLQVKAPADQAYLAMSWKVPGFKSFDNDADSQDALALTILAALLDGYTGSRLDRALTQGENRIADSAGASSSFSGRGPQVFVMDGVPAKGKTVEQLEAALRGQITRIAESGVSEAEMKRVKAQWMASTIYQRDSLFNQAREFGNLWVEGFAMDTPDRLVEALVAVTAEQVQAVAKKYFGDDQLTVATLLPQAGARPTLRKPVPGSRHIEGTR